MSTSILPAFIDAIVSKATTALPNVNVTDGVTLSENSGDYLMVGVDDPDLPGAVFSAESNQDVATMGTPRKRDERGQVTCLAMSWSGNTDAKSTRDAAFAIVAAVENLCRTDPSFGLAAGGLFVAGFGGDLRLNQGQGDFGTEARVLFTITFRARI